jgi:hypothetical protein
MESEGDPLKKQGGDDNDGKKAARSPKNKKKG